MPSFPDTAVLVLLALLLFGPKKLPVLARQLGKLMADFRRASNEFRSQMEEELRISEQAERQKQVAAIEASAPPKPAIDPPAAAPGENYPHGSIADPPIEPGPAAEVASEVEADPDQAPPPTPIATSGELSIMPPSTGLPIASSSAPGAAPQPHESELETETLHG